MLKDIIKYETRTSLVDCGDFANHSKLDISFTFIADVAFDTKDMLEFSVGPK